MTDRSLIKNQDIEVAPSRYLKIFRALGQVTFELSNNQHKELILAAHQFKEIEKQPSGFDREKWIEENIVPMPTGAAFAVFSFMLTVWNPTTIIQNTPSDLDGYVNVLLINEGFVQ